MKSIAFFPHNPPLASDDYQLVKLANGQWQTLFSASYGEKMHPGLGPQAEAELLYVRQLRIRERLAETAGEPVIWDVGLGAAANAIAALRATADIAGNLRLVSFLITMPAPWSLPLRMRRHWVYVTGYEAPVEALLRQRKAVFKNGKLHVEWEFHLVDFPAWLMAQNGRDWCPRRMRFSTTPFPQPKSGHVDAAGV